MDQYCDRLFADATGWLGWTPRTALTTPIGQIELALKGKVDMLIKTNPFGGGGEKETAKGQKAKPPAGDIGNKLRAALGGTRKVARK